MEEKERKRKSKSNDGSGSKKKTRLDPQAKEENKSEELNNKSTCICVHAHLINYMETCGYRMQRSFAVTINTSWQN